MSASDLLAEEAAELGIAGPLPVVRRRETATSTGRLSALLWGEAAAVTLLHGGGLNAHTWDATLLTLDVPAIAIDLPGHGSSEWRDDFDYSPRTNAVAVAAVLDELAPGVAQTVVGQSLGGLTAVALAAIRPDLVAGLVIVDVSPGLRPGDAKQVTEFLAGPQVFDSRDEIVQKALAAGIGRSDAALARAVELNTRIRDDGKVVFTHHLASPPQGRWPFDADFTDLWSALEGSDVPVLLVRGSRGFLSPDATEEFRDRVPRSIVIEIDAGHNVQEQQPARLAAAIRSFLPTPPPTSRQRT